MDFVACEVITGYLEQLWRKTKVCVAKESVKKNITASSYILTLMLQVHFISKHSTFLASSPILRWLVMHFISDYKILPHNLKYYLAYFDI